MDTLDTLDILETVDTFDILKLRIRKNRKFEFYAAMHKTKLSYNEVTTRCLKLSLMLSVKLSLKLTLKLF